MRLPSPETSQCILTSSSGEKLSIKASGDFKEEVGEGSKMHLQVKYGLITLINQERDACDTIEQADLKCPLKKGELSMTKSVDLPREIPPVRICSYIRRRLGVGTMANV